MSDTRTCKKCGETKSVDEFRQREKRGNVYRFRTCKQCANAEQRKIQAEKRLDKSYLERLRAYSRDGYHRRKDYYKAKSAEYRAKNRERIRDQKREHYYASGEAGATLRRERNKAWRQANREAYNSANRNYYQTSKLRKIGMNLRNRINDAVRYDRSTVDGVRSRRPSSTKRGARFIDLIGCTIEELKAQFESQFTEGMTWERFMSGEIHIDHIKPCASFDLTKVSEQKKCFHHTNLQPLWAKDNLRKHAKLDFEVPSLAA